MPTLNNPKTYKVINEQGKVVEYFRNKSTANYFIKKYLSNYKEKLEIVKLIDKKKKVLSEPLKTQKNTIPTKKSNQIKWTEEELNDRITGFT
jgi:hypothetical protein